MNSTTRKVRIGEFGYKAKGYDNASEKLKRGRRGKRKRRRVERFFYATRQRDAKAPHFRARG